ncbi:MAG: nucleotidyltransferase [Dolichospermum circinale Clear-D4]|nr:nucleotidyltransferase [Dolichospermum circinale Clear-D4]
MAKTVNAAFEEFLKDFVNLDSQDTKKARSSRNWLIEEQIHSFPERYLYFPTLYSEKDIYFGSFARRTKKRPLDDIDIMIALSPEGSIYYEYSTDFIQIYVPDSAYKLKRLCSDGTNKLNSIKVINKFIALLDQVPQYQPADKHRNKEAATLKLKSYDWNFDIVPCFFTASDYTGRTYYLIPDGKGNWKKTDPRIDRDRVTQVNQYHDGNILNLIRLMKYWNKRPTMPSMGSYLLENMILDFYPIIKYEKASSYIQGEIAKLLAYININVFNIVNDPKLIQGNINNLDLEDKIKISSRAFQDYQKSLYAIELENKGYHSLAMNTWGEIFGNNFPVY